MEVEEVSLKKVSLIKHHYIYIYIYIYTYRYIDQNLLKIKHKVNGWQNLSKHKTPYSYTQSFLSTAKHLQKIRRLGNKRLLYFFLYANSLKKFFASKTKFNCFKKMSIFFMITAPKNIKIQKIKFDVGFSYKDCI